MRGPSDSNFGICGPSRKHRYPDRKRALSALNRVIKTVKPGYPLRVYKCPKCRGWHLTSQPKR